MVSRLLDRLLPAGSRRVKSVEDGAGAPLARRASVDREALPAAAGRGGVRVLDGESTARHRVDEVDLGALEIADADRVDEQLHAVRLEDVVLARRFVDILQLVGQAGAAGGALSKAAFRPTSRRERCA